MPSFVFAAETEGLPGWAQVLIVIAAFIGVISKQIVPGWMYQDMKTERDAARQELKESIKAQLDTAPKVIAALEAQSRVMDDAMDEMRLLRRERDQAKGSHT